MATISTKIQLRNDDLSNWSEANPILSRGEAALAKTENGHYKLKIGNGVDNFNDLPYLNEDQLKTNDLYANSIQQGTQVEATPYGIAGGYFVKNAANYAQSFGTHVSVDNADKYSFTWNGKESICLCVDHETGRRFLGHNMYNSKGEGTFAINPKDGLSGFYVGEDSLYDLIKDGGLTKEDFAMEYVSSDNQLRLSVDDKVLCAEIHSGSSDDSLCAYVEQLEKDIYGENRDRSLTQIVTNEQIIQFLNKSNQKLEIDYVIGDESTYQNVVENIGLLWEKLGGEFDPSVVDSVEQVLVELKKLQATPELKDVFFVSIKEYVLGLNARIDQLSSLTPENFVEKDYAERTYATYDSLSQTAEMLSNYTNVKTRKLDKFEEMVLSGEYDDDERTPFSFTILAKMN